MACLREISLTHSAAARDLLQAGMDHAAQESMLESLMEVADFPKLFFDPTGFDSFRVLPNRGGRKIVALHRFEGCFRRQHAALDGQVNALEPLRIQQTGGVAGNHPAIT